MPVDLSGSIYAEFKRTLKRAEEATQRGANSEAMAAYRQCAELYRQYAASSSEPSVRRQRLERAELYAEMAHRMDKTNPPETRKPRFPVQAAEAAQADDYESDVLNLLERTNIHWDDIGGLDETKQAIKSAYGLALARKPKGVKIPSWRSILLFGPPGTGKTLLAAATAGSLEASFFNVKVSSVLSKYFGESSKLITTLYSAARHTNPAVIFLDEFESLVPPRGSGESGAERRITSTLLAELDGLATKEDNSFVLTMGATNLPWLLDQAILSRFQKRIYVPLPDEPARHSILEIHLTRRGHQSSLSMTELVRRTKGFSGREIEQLCQTAVTCMVQRGNPHLLDMVDQGLEAVRNFEIKVEPLTEADFEQAFSQVHPSTSLELLRNYDEWLRQAEVQ
jgi:katanin p60 ATPase-containing subunit A1